MVVENIREESENENMGRWEKMGKERKSASEKMETLSWKRWGKSWAGSGSARKAEGLVRLGSKQDENTRRWTQEAGKAEDWTANKVELVVLAFWAGSSFLKYVKGGGGGPIDKNRKEEESPDVRALIMTEKTVVLGGCPDIHFFFLSLGVP